MEYWFCYDCDEEWAGESDQGRCPYCGSEQIEEDDRYDPLEPDRP